MTIAIETINTKGLIDLYTWVQFTDPGLFKATMEMSVIHGDGLTLLTLDAGDDHIGINLPREDIYRMCEQILEDRDTALDLEAAS